MLKFGRVTRENMVKELTALFKENEAAIIVSFRNVDVNKFRQLKKSLSVSSVKFKIVKNSMARIAAKNAKLEYLAPLFEDTCAVGFCGEEALLASSGAFVNFSKENENFKIRGGSLTGDFMSLDGIKEFAMIPAREVLLAKAIGDIKSPISGFVGVLSNLVSGFIRTIDQIGKKK
jgi:large subunit ribosomal protein L10